jgi:3-methylcrotonyl-CoA carboxylase alpha subunit
MPGKLILLKVQAGQRVDKGDELAVMEAMKMELSIKAPSNGTVGECQASAGTILEADAPLFSWESSDG